MIRVLLSYFIIVILVLAGFFIIISITKEMTFSDSLSRVLLAQACFLLAYIMERVYRGRD